MATELKSIAQQLIDQANAVFMRLDQLQDQLTRATQSELQLSQPKKGNISRAKLLLVINNKIGQFVKPSSTYRVRDLRKYCEPFLLPFLTSADCALDSDNRPFWHGRFDYAHKDVARELGYQVTSNGVWRVP